MSRSNRNWWKNFMPTPGGAKVIVTGKVRGRIRQDRNSLNKTESRLDAWLASKPMLDRGEVGKFRVVKHYMHPGSFRIGVDGKRCYFYPDAKVLLEDKDGALWVEYWDCKVMWRVKDKATGQVSEKVGLEDDARVKLQAAANLYPEEQFAMAIVQADGTWTIELI